MNPFDARRAAAKAWLDGRASAAEAIAKLEAELAAEQKRREEAERVRDAAIRAHAEEQEIAVRQQQRAERAERELQVLSFAAGNTALHNGFPVEAQRVITYQAMRLERAEADAARLRETLRMQPCRCKCLTHGFGCGLGEATCRSTATRCSRCAALAAAPEPPADPVRECPYCHHTVTDRCWCRTPAERKALRTAIRTAYAECFEGADRG